MIRINLLPWREARRKAHNLQFYILMGMVAGLAASIVLLVHGYYATRISTQTERNTFLKDENTKLDKEIEEIKKLKEEIQALLSRKQVIETLQADRAQTVYLLELGYTVHLRDSRNRSRGMRSRACRSASVPPKVNRAA